MNLPIAVRLSQTLAMMALLSLCCIPKAFAQGDPSLIGELIWSDDFNAFQDAVWTHEVGDGCDKNICSWGNNERQYYAAENTSIESTPNDPDPSNTSLVIEARQEFRGNRDYTSARIISKNKISVLYGMLEVRMMVPDLDHGLWPAAWLLGDGATSWPQQGEIDMMEMGHSQHDREFNFCADVTTNQFVGSNIFHYAEGACNPDNATCAANYAWRESLNAPSNISPYCPEHSLDNRFVKYRLYWTPTSLDISIVDEVEGIEHSLINTFNIDATNPDIATFNEPFYLLLNMAVGGNLPGLPIFEPQNPVTAPTPGKMYVDYIHLHEYAGYGEVILGDGAEPVEEPLSGTVGVFTDRTDLDNYITPGTGSSVLVWGDTLIAGPVEPAYEGSNLISWQTEPSKGWFGAGIAAGAAKNFSNYTGGTLNFSMKVPADLSFKVGVISNAGENWIDFPANETTYGLERNGNWSSASIPVHTLRDFSVFGDKVDLSQVTNMFAILSADGGVPSIATPILIDDIYWSPNGGVDVTDSDNDSVIDLDDQCPGTIQGVRVGNDGCEIAPQTGVVGVFTETAAVTKMLDGSNSDVWIWENTLSEGPALAAAEGTSVLTWTGAANHWFGAGIEARNPIDFSEHREGLLKFMVKVPADIAFQVGLLDQAGAQSWLDFPANTTIYGLDRNAAAVGYALASIPIHYLAGPSASGYAVDLHSLKYVFTLRNGEALPSSVFDIAVDDIVWSDTGGVSVSDEDDDGVIDLDDECLGTLAASRVSNAGCAIIAQVGTFGLATETTVVNAQLDDSNSDTWIWDNSFSACEGSSYEGEQSICWHGNANHWFGGGIQARAPLDMSNFDEGNLRFHIKVPADVEFRVGISDTYGNESYVLFPANTSIHGLSRSGEWEEVVIPVSVLRGYTIDLRSLSYAFTVLSRDGFLASSGFDMQVDNIYYDGGVVSDSDADGINDANDQCANTPNDAVTNAAGCSAEQIDTDGDGVPDMADSCANTLPGSDVDSNGCINVPCIDASCMDGDGDGVNDDLDVCPATPEGTVVDTFGCQLNEAVSVRIQAEDFDNHFDVTPGNSGGGYRPDVDADIQACLDSGGGFNLGWMDAGDWIEFTVELEQGEYELLSRVASPIDSGAYTISINGEDLVADSVPATGSWQSWQTRTLGQYQFNAGVYTVRISVTGAGFNLNWIEFNVGGDEEGMFFGHNVVDSGTVEFYVNSPEWADVHYIVNDANQQNFRMENDGIKSTRVLNGLSTGDDISYRFVYWDSECGCQIVTNWANTQF